MHHPQTYAQVEDTIWEVNDRLDGHITWSEYKKNYERCKNDKTGLEPSNLFYLISFLMYDKDGGGSVKLIILTNNY